MQRTLERDLCPDYHMICGTPGAISAHWTAVVGTNVGASLGAVPRDQAVCKRSGIAFWQCCPLALPSGLVCVVWGTGLDHVSQSCGLGVTVESQIPDPPTPPLGVEGVLKPSSSIPQSHKFPKTKKKFWLTELK